MEDKNSVNVGKLHSSGVDVLSPQPSEQGLAGRELDKAVAGQVFGVKKIFRPCDMKTRDDYWSPEEYHYIPSGKPLRTHMIDAKVIPYFSTDIAAAMEVVEKVRERFPRIEIRTHENLDGWACEFSSSSNGDNISEIAGLDISDTLPEAICRAALATVNAPAQEMETQKLR